jgi:hypothetical protein
VGDDKELSMRFLIPSLVLAIAALMNATDLASAQSPTSYPWCSRSGRSSANNCLLHEQRAMPADDFRNWRLLLGKPVSSAFAPGSDEAVNARRAHP